MIVLLQVLAALLVGVFYYMLAVVLTMYDGFLTLIFQPIAGLLFSGVAIIVLLLVGLPIRLSKTINRWWRKHWWIPLALGISACVMMFLSLTPPFLEQVMDPELNEMVDCMNTDLGGGGWLLTIFAVLHFYPPIFTRAVKSDK